MWQKLKRQLWNWRGVLIAAPGLAALILGVRSIGFLQLLELAMLDQLFLMRPQETVDSRFVIVDITEEDVRAVGHWPMNDRLMARLIKNIRAQKPAAIGLDIYRDLPVEPGYAELVDVFKTTPNLIGIQKVSTSADSSEVKPSPVLQAQGQVAANDFPLDSDGKVRRAIITAETTDGDVLLGFSFHLSMLYLSQYGIQPENTPDDKVKLGSTIFTPFEPNDGGYANTNAGGYQVLVNYRGDTDRFPRITLAKALANQIPPGLMTGKIVMIGASATSLNDLFYTPYSSKLFETNSLRMPGVVYHANIASHFISAALDNRPLIYTWPDWAESLWTLGWAFVGAMLIWAPRNVGMSTKKAGGSGRFWQSRVFIMTTSLIVTFGGLLGGSYLAFLSGWWIPVVPASLSLGLSAVAIVGYIAITAAEIRKTFGRYLTDEVVANLLETPEGLKLGGERRKVTILMSDLRGFSAFSERLAPEQVVTILNMYLGEMADVITQYNGTIDEFIGDAILVIFGAPTQRPDDAERAVACALAMQLAMEPVNRRNQEMGLPVLEMGIGINTGEVVVGNIGSQKRAKYGIVGSHVNLTGRIESYTVGGQILISPDTYREIKQVVTVTGQMQVEPKGIKEPITIYEVGGIGGNHNLFLPKAKETFTPLEHPIPLKYTVLEGKHMVGTLFAGTLVKLSPNGGVIQTESPLSPLSNIKINLFMDDSGESEGDLYAKVLELEDEQTHFVCLRFTAVPPDVATMFSTMLKEVVPQH